VTCGGRFRFVVLRRPRGGWRIVRQGLREVRPWELGEVEVGSRLVLLWAVLVLHLEPFLFEAAMQ
jgi:hypothetical protein